MPTEPTGPTDAGVGSRRGSLGGRSSRQPSLDATRWKVERALSWLSYWRLQVRWDRDAVRWFAFVLVALCGGVLQPALAGQKQ